MGGGRMGFGIAPIAAQAGSNVNLVYVKDAALQKSENNIQTSLQRAAKKIYKDDASKGEKFVTNLIQNLTFTFDLPEAVKNADLAIEAIVENIDTKHKLCSGRLEINYA